MTEEELRAIEERAKNAALGIAAQAGAIRLTEQDVPALCAEVRRLQSHMETVIRETDAANERATAAWQRADQADRRESDERAEVRHLRVMYDEAAAAAMQGKSEIDRMRDLLRETDERTAELGHQNERLREETAAACLRADRAERGEGWLREHAAAMTNERDQWREEALQHDTTVAGAGAILRDWADPV